MAKPRLLQHGRLLPALERQLADEYELHLLAEEADPDAYLKQHGGGFVGLVTSAPYGAPARILDACPNVRVISSFGVGLDQIDVADAQRRGIAVGYTPDVLNDCVADTAFGLVLDVARGLSASDRFVRSGRWLTERFPLGRRVSGAKLGIVGLGRIGRTIARRAGGFEMQVRYHSRRRVDDAPWPHEPSLIELARWADFLVVITAGGAATRHLVNAEVLDALGPEGYIVNVSRGTVIDEAALVRALVGKRIAGAGLDVYEREPHVPAELMTLDNVVLLPHIASGTHETRQAMADLVIENLRSFFATGRPVAPAPLS